MPQKGRSKEVVKNTAAKKIRKSANKRARKLLEKKTAATKDLKGLKSATAKKAVKKGAKAVAPTGLAPSVPCVPATQAGPVVMGCAGQNFNVETTLGVAFPSPNRREQFCQCVSAQSGVPRAEIPCGAGDRFVDVIEAISC